MTVPARVREPLPPAESGDGAPRLVRPGAAAGKDAAELALRYRGLEGTRLGA